MLDFSKETWPPDYVKIYVERQTRLKSLRREPISAREFYRNRPIAFISHWGMTYDPRLAQTGVPPVSPFIPFRRQKELIQFVYACLKARTSGLIEKSRDMGATWICCAISVHLFLFWEGASIGWGSRKAMSVDQIGRPDSIFEKIRIFLRYLPRELLPEGFSFKDHMSLMKIINPENNNTITGEAGDDIGRGGRTLIYFKDEAGHLEHPEMVEASLLANALVQMDISSVPVHSTGTVFQRRRESGVEWSPGTKPKPNNVSVFVMDWREHPGKTQQWYDDLRARMEREGMLHVLAAEVDRDYSAAVQGTVIPAEWVRSAIDAHLKLKFKGSAFWCAALDVADAGGDTNALAKRQGVTLASLEEWGERDTGRTTRRAVDACRAICPVRLQYDAVGMGSSVKAESNRLGDEDLLPKGLRLVPWNAGGAVQDPDKRVIEGDRDSPLNKDFYANLKAQGWWQLRRRFELTYRAVQACSQTVAAVKSIRGSGGELPSDDFTWDEDDLISLPSDLPLLWKLVKELSQPTMTHTSSMKLLVDKAPEGTRSPNLADAVVMCYFPMKASGPFDIPDAALRRARMPTMRRG